MRSRVAAQAVGLAATLLLAVPGAALAFAPMTGMAPHGSGPGQASLATAIEVAADGLVYVSDFNNHRVDVFTSSGAFVRAFGKGVSPAGGDVCTATTGCQKGATGSAAGAIPRPTGIAVDPSGTVYVGNAENNRVDVFTANGAYLRSFAKGVKPGGGDVCTVATGCQKGAETEVAGSLWAVTGIVVAPNGQLYIAGYFNHRIDVFNADGSFVRAFGRGVNPSGASTCTVATGCRRGIEIEAAGGIPLPFDMAINGNNEIAVTDFYNKRISVFSLDGTFVRAFGKGVKPGGGDLCTVATGCQKGTESHVAGALPGPNSVSVGPAGTLYVTDTLSNRVGEFNFDGSFVRAFGEGVVDGAATFQVCTTATGCAKGLVSSNPSSIVNPYGLAVDCAGTVYAMSYRTEENVPQVRRFGESTAPEPPCLPPPAAAGGGAALLTGGGEALAASKGSRLLKPSITVELNPGSGTASLMVVVSEPGRLLLKGKGIRKTKKRASRTGVVEILLTPTAKVKAKLKKKGKAKVKAVVIFAAEGGGSIAQSLPVKLKMVRGF